MTDREKAIDALRRLKPSRCDGRGDWLHVGMALHSVDEGQAMLAAWIGWSRGSAKFVEGECERQWRSFDGNGGIGLGTLLKAAIEDDPSFSEVLARSSAEKFGGAKRRNARTWRSRADAIAALEREVGGKLARSGSYHDEAGVEVFEVLRFDLRDKEGKPVLDGNGKRKKTFRPLRRDGTRWVAKDPEGKLPLYGLAGLRDAKLVFVVEGERCADALRAVGLVATTSAHGALSAGRTDWRPLAGKDVVHLPDNDKDGDRHLADVASELAGLAPVRPVRLEGLPPGGDVVDWLGAGHTAEQLVALAEQAKPVEPPVREAAVSIRVLDDPPAFMRRPLCLHAGRAYAAFWPWVERTVREETDRKGTVRRLDPPRVELAQVLAVMRDDGAVFCDGTYPEAKPIRELGLVVHLPEVADQAASWSSRGAKSYAAGHRPDPADVFRRVTRVIDGFVDFSRSFGPQDVMCELVACYVFGTYMLDAFMVVGYLWPNGDKGCGKTIFLNAVTGLAYLGRTILAGGSYASLRDLADYGATLGFDDAEDIMDQRKSDPDKRALLLAGNRRGASATVKEAAGAGRWVTRHVNAFCPRLFSAIRLPDPVLASRTITVPLVRSTDRARTAVDPLDFERWPLDRTTLIDDFWATALMSLPQLREYDRRAAGQSSLLGRDLDGWRTILGVALWLEERHAVAGLAGRMHALSVEYQRERSEIEASDRMRLHILALRRLAGDAAERTFQTKDLVEVVNAVARELEVLDKGDEDDFTTPRRTGHVLKQLRLSRPDQRAASGKLWTITQQELAGCERAYGIVRSEPDPGPGDDEEERDAIRDEGAPGDRS